MAFGVHVEDLVPVDEQLPREGQVAAVSSPFVRRRGRDDAAAHLPHDFLPERIMS